MAFTPEQVRANRDYFALKLAAEKQRNDVFHAAESGNFDFTLLDTRGREAFAMGHIPGAVVAHPGDELAQFMTSLPRDQEVVTYCWSHD